VRRVGDVVFEDGGHVFLVRVREGQSCQFGGTNLGKVARAVADEQTRLAAPTIADDDQLFRVGGRFGEGSVPRCIGCIGCVRAHCAVAVALARGADGPADGRN
jgi:hypothetical protein